MPRHPKHDYRSRCIYHIVLNKAKGIPDFSRVRGHGADAGLDYTPLGRIIAPVIYHLSDFDPRIRTCRYSVMPDHLHLLVDVHERIPNHLGAYIAMAKAKISQRYTALLAQQALRAQQGQQQALLAQALQEHGRPGLLPDRVISVFEPDYYDCILWADRDLDTIYKYIQDNPRRLADRRDHPEWFRRVNALTLDGLPCRAYGNMQLLHNPFIEAVVVRSHHNAEQREANRRRWLHAAANRGVLVSAAYAEAEKKIMKEADESGSKFIILTDKPMDEHFKPQGHAFELCTQGRLLLIYVEPSLFSRKREWCLRMNALAAALQARPLART